jgi:PhnB protein
MPTVVTYLAIDGAAKALEFYKIAFGAKELTRQATPDGKIIHASMKIGNTAVMMSDIFPGSDAKSPLELGTSPVTLHINSDDVDELWNRALAAGAKVSMPLENQFWGDRYGQLVDPFGHHWSMSMKAKMSKEEMAAKQKDAMSMFSQNEHPGQQQ